MRYLGTTILTFLLIAGFAFGGFSQQTKIGYANVELILLYMPETQSMNQTLQTYQNQLGKKLQAKQEYAQTKLEEYQAFAQQTPPPSEAELEPKQQELIKLDEEIQKETAQAEQKLAEKRQTLMEPIAQKLETGLKELAAEEGYDLILNTVDAGGVSIVLYGPPEHDLTKKMFAKLGIPVPEGVD
ncbi:MAG: OmpH family outer membrane protein [Bacteroidia bacterium]